VAAFTQRIFSAHSEANLSVDGSGFELNCTNLRLTMCRKELLFNVSGSCSRPTTIRITFLCPVLRHHCFLQWPITIHRISPTTIIQFSHHYKKHDAFPLDIVEVKNTGHGVVTMELHVKGLEGHAKTITFQSPKFHRNMLPPSSGSK
jgi:hypothetical protein